MEISCGELTVAHSFTRSKPVDDYLSANVSLSIYENFASYCHSWKCAVWKRKTLITSIPSEVIFFILKFSRTILPLGSHTQAHADVLFCRKRINWHTWMNISLFSIGKFHDFDSFGLQLGYWVLLLLKPTDDQFSNTHSEIALKNETI